MTKQLFNKAFLDELVKRDNATLLGDYALTKMNRDTNIKFKCLTCDQDYCKKFRYIKEEGGFYCKCCTSKKASEKAKKTFLEKYGVENPSLSEEVKKKRDNTNLERRGVVNPFSDKSVQEKIKQTNLEKRGVEYSAQDPEIISQRKETNLRKYGVEYTLQNREVREKGNTTILEKYGVDNISKNEDIKEKKIQTSLSNYGVEHPAQHPDICEKMAENKKKIKDFITPSGKLIKLQGYEHHAYTKLLKEYNEDEIITSKKEVPEIWWDDDDGKSHRYFIDFYIPKNNLLIEVKSTRTFDIGINKKKLYHTFKKCVEEGYSMEIWIVSQDGKVLNVITTLEDLIL